MRQRANNLVRPCSRRAGFTLAELLVTLMLTALLTGAIVGATRTLTTARRSVDERVARASAARQGLEAVVAALRNVRRDPDREPPLVIGRSRAPGDDRIDIQIIDDTRARRDGPECDQYEVGFYLWQREADDVPCLMCRRKNGLTDTPGGGGMATVAAEGVVGLSFQYYSMGEWVDEWPETETTIPEAVRVTVSATGVPSRRSARPLEPMVLSTVVPLAALPPVATVEADAAAGQPGQPGAPPPGGSR